MASHAAQIYRAMKDVVFDTLPPALDVHSVILADVYRIGPELVAALKPEALNCLVVSPLSGQAVESDAHHNTEALTYDWQLSFVYPRVGTELEHVIDRWADPLHTHLGLMDFRALGGAHLYIEDAAEAQHNVGRVRRFAAGAVDFDPPENGQLFDVSGGTLAAFTIPIRTTATVSKDWRTRQ